MNTPTTIRPDDLPRTILDYLAAHDARDVDAALRTLDPEVTITDEGRTFRGTDGAGDFLSNAGAEFTFTTALVGALRVGAERWVAVNRIEGDFPGGIAELHYRFTMDGGLITELVIAPDVPATVPHLDASAATRVTGSRRTAAGAGPRRRGSPRPDRSGR